MVRILAWCAAVIKAARRGQECDVDFFVRDPKDRRIVYLASTISGLRLRFESAILIAYSSGSGCHSRTKRSMTLSALQRLARVHCTRHVSLMPEISTG